MNIRYEVLGCGLALVLILGLLVVSVVTIIGSTMLLAQALGWLRLPEGISFLMWSVWMLFGGGYVLSAAVIGGEMVYERLMRRWFEE